MLFSLHMSSAIIHFNLNPNSNRILVTERWARSWSQCMGSQRLLSPGLCSPSQPKNVTVLWPVPSYTAWWQKHIVWATCRRLICSLAAIENRTHNLTITSSSQCTTSLTLITCWWQFFILIVQLALLCDYRRKHDRGLEITGLSWHPLQTTLVYCDNHGYFSEWSSIIDTPASHNVSSNWTFDMLTLRDEMSGSMQIS